MKTKINSDHHPSIPKGKQSSMAVRRGRGGGTRGIVATNFSEDCTKREIEAVFREVGPINRCNLCRDKGTRYLGTVIYYIHVALACWIFHSYLL